MARWKHKPSDECRSSAGARDMQLKLPLHVGLGTRTCSVKMFLSLWIWAMTMPGAPPSTCFGGRIMKVRSQLKLSMPSS